MSSEDDRAVTAAQKSGPTTVTAHPHGELTTYFGRTFGGVQVTITPGMTIAAMLEQLGVPSGEVWICALNGTVVKPDATLAAGDNVELFAPVAGG